MVDLPKIHPGQRFTKTGPVCVGPGRVGAVERGGCVRRRSGRARGFGPAVVGRSPRWAVGVVVFGVLATVAPSGRVMAEVVPADRPGEDALPGQADVARESSPVGQGAGQVGRVAVVTRSNAGLALGAEADGALSTMGSVEPTGSRGPLPAADSDSIPGGSVSIEDGLLAVWGGSFSVQNGSSGAGGPAGSALGSRESGQVTEVGAAGLAKVGDARGAKVDDAGGADVRDAPPPIVRGGVRSRLAAPSDGAERAAPVLRASADWFRSGLGALAVVLALVGGAYWFVRRWVPSARVGHDGVLQVVTRAALSPKHSLALVQVGRQRFVLVGMAGERMTCLSQIEASEEVADLAGCVSRKRGGGDGFGSDLNEAFKAFDRTERTMAGEPTDGGPAPDDVEQTRGQVRALLTRLQSLGRRSA